MAAEGFAAVPTWMIRDKRVPRNAILVYASLSSRSGLREIYPSQETIAEESGLSDRTVRKMLKELETLGVLTRERRKSAGVKRATDSYRLHPNGLPEDLSGRGDLPEANPVSTGNEEQVIPLIEVDKGEVEKTPTPSGLEDLESLFSEAWQHWPKKTEKKNSLAKFKTVVKRYPKQNPRALVATIITFGDAYASTTETQFVPALCVWLNGERWTDPLPQAPMSRAEQRTANNLAIVDAFDEQKGLQA